ncbi:hypothetical protein [endosymbiont GvMRE of Glomus versiforme]|uniref:hypothetical protein n=1 Tax=endosymbiont GvMRE of Glomus versiforme TaxID=2039283 RepID=UPI0011C34E44|nr:hypothetical protein [endosymbiont GvMRE of Glomus versiforme]
MKKALSTKFLLLDKKLGSTSVKKAINKEDNKINAFLPRNASMGVFLKMSIAKTDIKELKKTCAKQIIKKRR